jgi:hypothetical protein
MIHRATSRCSVRGARCAPEFATARSSLSGLGPHPTGDIDVPSNSHRTRAGKSLCSVKRASLKLVTIRHYGKP